MKLQKLHAKNFKCFDELEFDFPESNGLYYLTGENLHTPANGGNGCGKTTLFDAVCWCLYGKTAKGKIAGSLMREEAKGGYSVSLVFGETVITRSWKPNTLTINGEEATQEEINNFVGLTYDQFMLSIYFKQEDKHFIDLSPTEKLNFLSKIFQLDDYLTAADDCKEKVKQQKTALTVIQTRVDLLEGELTRAQDELAKISGQTLSWSEENKLKVADMEAQIESLKSQVCPIPSITDLQNEIKEVDAVVFELESIIKQDQKNEVAHQNSITTLRTQIKTIEGQLETILAKVGSACPTCNQIIPESSITAVSTDLLEKVEAKERELLEVEQKKVELLFTPEIEYELKNLRILRAEVTAAMNDLNGKIMTQNNLASSIKSMESSMMSIRTTKNPHQVHYDSLFARYKEALKEKEQAAEEIKTIDADAADVEFWAKEFPLTRLWTLEEITNDLEIHFNEALAHFGLHDWNLQVLTERELANKKDTKREMNFRLTCQDKEKDIEMLSGGELQRIRLASAFGISDLVLAKCAKVGLQDFRFMDEPTHGLHAIGIEYLLDFLGTMADTNTVFIADHKILDLGKFTGTYQLTKHENNVSTIKAI